MGLTSKYFHILPTSCTILLTIACVCYLNIVEDIGVGTAAWVCSACWCAWRNHVVDGCNLITTEHGRCGLSCIQKLWSAWAVVNLYGMLECQLCCELLFLLNTAHIWVVIYVEGCWVSSACWCVVMCSFSWCEYTNVHVESFVVCIVGKMAQDVGMVWKCRGFLPI